MRRAASLLLAAAAAFAQTQDAPLGDYRFVQLHLRGSRKPLARNLGGLIAFDAGGRYRLQASMGSGNEAAQPLNAEGSFQVSPAGTLSMTNPARAGSMLRLRASGGATVLIGSSVETGEEEYDLFVAFKAGSGLSAASLRGQYGGAYLSLDGGESKGLVTAFVDLQADGAGSFSRSTIDGHLAAVDDSMRREQIAGSTYSLRSDGTGTARFAESSDILAGDREIFVAPGGALMLGFSTGPDQRDLLVAVRKSPEVAPFLFRGPYWISELLAENDFVFNPDGARFGAAAGVISANGEGSAAVAQRVQMAGRRTNLSTVNRYFLASNSPAMFGPALRIGIGNFALSEDFGMFVGAQIGAEGDLVLQHGVFVGVRQSPVSGSGAFLDPLGVASPAAPGIPAVSISPGSLVTLAGTGLAAASVRAPGDAAPELGGVRVTFNGDAAPLRSVSSNFIEAIAPANLAPGLARVQATVDGRTSNVIEIDVASTSPAAFTPAGSTWVSAFHPDFTPVTLANPAAPGTVVVLSLAGLGAGLNDLGALFAGRPGEIEYAGAVPGFVGVYQVNVKLPDDFPPGSAVPVAIRTADSFSDLAELPVRTARQ